MRAAVFQALEEAGVTLSLVEGALQVEAEADPPAVVVALLQVAKRELTALLLAERAPALWSKDDLRAFFTERAGVFEFDCGLTRAQAEAEALGECVHLYTGRRIG